MFTLACSASPKSSPRLLRRTPPEADGHQFAGKASFVRKPWSVLIIFVLLAFGVSLAVPAEDVPETAYDESEALPFEGVPLFSIPLQQVAARTQVPVSSGHLKLITPSPFTPAHVRDTSADRSVDQRALSALLCNLRC